MEGGNVELFIANGKINEIIQSSGSAWMGFVAGGDNCQRTLADFTGSEDGEEWQAEQLCLPLQPKEGWGRFYFRFHCSWNS